MKTTKKELVVRVEPREEKTAHVVLDGSLDAFNFDKFRKAMTDLTEAGALFIVLDLRAMTYVASVGINFLINLRVQRRKAGGELYLVKPQPNVMKILKMLGLLEVLIVSESPEQAWSDVRARLAGAGPADVPLIE